MLLFTFENIYNICYHKYRNSGENMKEELNKYWDNIHKEYTSTYDEWFNKYIELLHKDDNIVELGCGRAYTSKYLITNGYKNIIACDFSEEVLKIVNIENPDIKTMLFDMSNGLPFDDNSKDIIIADLSLHYFDLSKTKYIFNEIYRVLKENGYLIARVNSFNDSLHIPVNSKEIEKHFYYDGKIYKRFFDKDDFEELFKNFKICNLEEKKMDRYEKPKILWEFCIKKEKY